MGIRITDSLKQETARLNDAQMEILVRNHGSLAAVRRHMEQVSNMVNTIHLKAKGTKKKACYVLGSDEKPLQIDPVSWVFHQEMLKAKKRQGLVGYWRKPSQLKTINPADYPRK